MKLSITSDRLFIADDRSHPVTRSCSQGAVSPSAGVAAPVLLQLLPSVSCPCTRRLQCEQELRSGGGSSVARRHSPVCGHVPALYSGSRYVDSIYYRYIHPRYLDMQRSPTSSRLSPYYQQYQHDDDMCWVVPWFVVSVMQRNRHNVASSSTQQHVPRTQQCNMMRPPGHHPPICPLGSDLSMRFVTSDPPPTIKAPTSSDGA